MSKFVYIHDYVYLEDGIIQAIRITKKTYHMGAYRYTLENNMSLITPNTIELEVGSKVTLTTPIVKGKYHEPEFANLVALLNAYSIGYGSHYILYIPNTSAEELKEISKQLQSFGRKYFRKNVDISFDPSNTSIDISDFYYNFKAHTQLSLGKVPDVVLLGDMATTVAFFGPFLPLFQEVNKGYMLRLLSDTLFDAVLNMLIRIGIVPIEVNINMLILSRKDFETLQRMASGQNVPVYKPVELEIIAKDIVGIKPFVNVSGIKAVNGITIESMEAIHAWQ